MYLSLTKSVVLKVMMNVTDSSISSFANGTCFVNQIIHLSRNRLTRDTKNSTFARGLKINGSRLHWIAGNMDFLWEIKRVMHCDVKGTDSMLLIQVDSSFNFFKNCFRFLADPFIQISFRLHTVQMFLLNQDTLSLFPVQKVGRSNQFRSILLAGYTQIGHRLRNNERQVKLLPKVDKFSVADGLLFCFLTYMYFFVLVPHRHFGFT